MHQLSRIQIQATAGSNTKYSYQIAGIRIGNPIVEGKFSYSTDFTDAASIGSWVLHDSPKKHKVEYIFKAGDQIVSLGNKEKSIMGLGGNAMVIPAEIGKWVLPADPSAVVKPYTTGQMYFSVLLRVERGASQKIVYPYPDVQKYPGMKIVYLAIDDNSNKVLAQLRKGLNENLNEIVYYSIDDSEEPYQLPEGASIKEFGWAAIPVGVNWATGKSYLYTLDYSNGIGYHDPEDPEPGTPIVEEDEQPGEVILSVALTPWEDGDNSTVEMPSSSDDTTTNKQ